MIQNTVASRRAAEMRRNFSRLITQGALIPVLAVCVDEREGEVPIKVVYHKQAVDHETLVYCLELALRKVKEAK